VQLLIAWHISFPNNLLLKNYNELSKKEDLKQSPYKISVHHYSLALASKPEKREVDFDLARNADLKDVKFSIVNFFVRRI